MVVGEIINAIGSGLLITIGVSTHTDIWATFLALAGFGDGIAINMPFIAVQATLEKYLLHSTITIGQHADWQQ